MGLTPSDAAEAIGALLIGMFTLLMALVAPPLTIALLVAWLAGGPDCPVEGPRGMWPRAAVEVYEFYRELLESEEETIRRCDHQRPSPQRPLSERKP